MSLARLGYAAALLPLLTIHLAFFTSVVQGYIEPCLPYWSDCVSISRSGRHGLAYVLFKAGMIPATLLLGWFWQRCVSNLQSFIKYGSRLVWAGWAASLALLLYTLALGHAGEGFQLLRRFGVVLFMGLTFIVQVSVGRALQKLPAYKVSATSLLSFSAVILGIAIFSLLLDLWLGSAYDRIENAFEWWLILLLILHLVALSRVLPAPASDRE